SRYEKILLMSTSVFRGDYPTIVTDEWDLNRLRSDRDNIGEKFVANEEVALQRGLILDRLFSTELIATGDTSAGRTYLTNLTHLNLVAAISTQSRPRLIY
ncbi:hypothetical protein ACHMWS_16810, partial [Aeromonas caviae]|uniref:hypothetical protein n=1 Tax=Aeromonas caviae TaxID=648 RepID=UPI003754D6B6